MAGEWWTQQVPGMRERWRLLTVVGGGLLVVCMALAARQDSIWSSFASGLLAGTFLAAVIAFLFHTAAAGRRSALTNAVEWTAQQLRHSARDGWCSWNELSFERRGDVDHVVLGTGGVYAVRSRWSTDWTGADGRRALDEATRDARAAARATQRLLAGKPARLPGDVQPLVVAWGRGAPRAQAVNGVPVVPGAELSAWLALRQVPRLTVDDLDRSEQVLDAKALRHEISAAFTDPTQTLGERPASDLATSVGVALVAGLAAFAGLVLFAPGVRLGPLVLGVGAALIGAVLVSRRRLLHYAGLGWLTGAATGIFVVVAALHI
jgi:hypothetical protein